MKSQPPIAILNPLPRRSPGPGGSILHPRSSPPRANARSGPCHAEASRGGGFTLIELLVVIGIISLLLVLLVPAFNGLKRADDITSAAYSVSGALENGRTFAMANNTYAWVGFFEEDVANTPSTNPRPPGTGRVIISIVASKEGNRYKDTLVDATNPHLFYPLPAPSPIAASDSNPVILTQVGKLIQVDNTHLAVLSATAPARATVDTEFQVAAIEFGNHPQNAPGSAPVLNPTTFNYPLGAVSPNIVYTFTKIIEFSPRGEAVKIVDLPTQLLEIGLQPTHGNTADTNAANTVAIQIAGATGRAKNYRR